ncbi:hypothetical protein ACQ33O_07770 [Ferruginibacter sp. SUN002]|uniref:hypothetical protein n=1 Tax=Ferruginibacter sp. SUN002 TaxID=2937789 RepID=UPI003D36C5BA
MAEVSTYKKDSDTKRSDFLTGLCIASIIGGCWSIICGFVQYIKAEDQTEAVVKEVRDILTTDEFQRSLSSGIASKIDIQMATRMAEAFTIENLQIIAIAGIVSGVLTLIGVYFMWNEQKKGFYFYLSGLLIGLFTLLILFKLSKAVTMGMLALNGIITLFKLFGASSNLALSSFILTLIVWVGFTAMYWKQVKNMN